MVPTMRQAFDKLQCTQVYKIQLCSCIQVHAYLEVECLRICTKWEWVRKQATKGGQREAPAKFTWNKRKTSKIEGVCTSRAGNVREKPTGNLKYLWLRSIYCIYSTFLIEDTENLRFHRIFWILLHVKLQPTTEFGPDYACFGGLLFSSDQQIWFTIVTIITSFQGSVPA